MPKWLAHVRISHFSFSAYQKWLLKLLQQFIMRYGGLLFTNHNTLGGIHWILASPHGQTQTNLHVCAYLWRRCNTLKNCPTRPTASYNHKVHNIGVSVYASQTHHKSRTLKELWLFYPYMIFWCSELIACILFSRHVQDTGSNCIYLNH